MIGHKKIKFNQNVQKYFSKKKYNTMEMEWKSKSKDKINCM